MASAGDDREAQIDLSTAELWLGVALSEASDFEKSLLFINRALDSQKKVFEADKNDFSAQNSLADCYLELGRALTKKLAETQKANLSLNGGEFERAVSAYQNAIKNYQSVLDNDKQNLSTRRQIAFTKKNLAETYRLNSDPVNALTIFVEATKELEMLTEIDRDNKEWQYDLAFCHLRIGEISLPGDRPQALIHLEKSRDLLVKLANASPENIRIKNDLVTVEKYFT